MKCDMTLVRRGTFEVGGVRNDECQCGPRGARKFYFRVDVDCSEEALDERGFVFDQFELLRVVQQRYARLETLPSCERLAIDLVKLVRELCPGATAISASIGTGPEPEYGMTARWAA